MADLARRDTNNQNLRYGKTHTEQIYISFFIIIHEYKNSVCLYNGKRQNGKEKDKQQGNAIIVRAESDG